MLKLRQPFYWLVSLIAIGLVLGIAWLILRRDLDEAPRRTELLEPAMQVEIPRSTPSAVESLRARTKAGDDRFVVEEADEAIEPRLETLRRVFLEPVSEAGRSAAADVLSTAVSVDALGAGASQAILESTGITVQAVAPASEAARGTGVDTFLKAISDWIAPQKSLESAAFKVLEIQGNPKSGGLVSTVHFELCSADGTARRQWTGAAVLGWTKEADAWKLSSWTTKDSVLAALRSRPFEDVTALALGANASYASLLSLGLDDFRDRLDAATGIDVYGHHGLAVGDANGDGFEDLYVAMPPGLPNQLLLGREGGRFEDSSAASGADALDGTYQALFIDVENDGDEDLFLVTETGILLLKNDGGGRFREAPSGIAEMSATRSTPISAAAADYDRDGFVDVYVCAYVFWRGSSGELGSRLPFPYHEAHNGAPNFLFRNRRDGTFEDVTEKSGLNVDNNRFSFAASWGDYDSDNDPDLYVANDFGSNNLYRNNGDGTFTEVTREAGVEDVGAGMSVAWEDVDNDGDLDLYVGNMLSSAGRRVTGTSDYKAGNPALQRLYRRHARGNSLFRNRGDGTFEDVSEPTRAYFGRWSWASGFVDFNLDGREDIYVQNGFLTNAKKDDL